MKKILTIILDGFGMKEDVYGNAVKNAGMTNFINIWNEYPHTLLTSTGPELGLPEDEPMNSELAHKIIGAGKKSISKYEIVKRERENNTFIKNTKYKEMVKYLKESRKSLHIVFFLSDSLLNSNIEDLKYVINSLKERNINNVYLHLITDGEDSSKFSSLEYFKQHSDDFSNVKIASLCGKYYAFDRTKDYEKTQVFYDLLVSGKGVNTPDIKRIIKICYDKKITDAYLPPIKTSNFVKIDYEDCILFLNYGRDLQYQIIKALTSPLFEEFKTIDLKAKIYSLFKIRKNFNIENFFEEETENNTLCEYIGKLGLSQARITEEIKKESLIYYIDGARNIEIENCENYVLKTNKVEYISKKPEMKSLNIARLAVKCMENDYDFIITNFANPDIIGHTGIFQATINSLQAIDVCLGKMIEVANENFYKIIIVGSHPNCDTIIDRNNNIITKNTLSKVPFIIMDKKVNLKPGNISMISPTILKYMDIALPKEMQNTDNLFSE